METAQDARSLAAVLRAQGLVPVHITEMTADAPAAAPTRRRRGGRPKLDDIAPFVRQLSVMLNAGVSLDVSLGDLAKQIDRTSFAGVVNDLRDRVWAGERLSDAMKVHSQVFTPLVVALVHAGEESGKLAQILGDLASYLESQVQLRRHVVTALSYPAFVAAFFTLVVLFLFLFFLPKFEGIYAALDQDLPLITVWALGVSAWMRRWFFLILVVLAGAVALAVVYGRTPKTRKRLDAFMIRLPVLGDVLLKSQLVRFAETFATLQRSGVPILASLDIAKTTAGNHVIEAALGQAREEILRGSFLSREMAKHPIFPQMLVRIVAVGEETGNTSELLAQAAAFYKDEVDASVRRATRLIEPIIIIFLGMAIALVLLAAYLPVFKLAEAMG